MLVTPVELGGELGSAETTTVGLLVGGHVAGQAVLGKCVVTQGTDSSLAIPK